MKTLYTELMPLREFGGDMVERLKAHSVYHIFKPLVELYEHDTESLNKALFYILMVYSKDSEAMKAGLSWEQSKLAVCQELSITGALQFEMVDCMSDAVNETVAAYLDYQGSRIWEHLMVVRELYEEMKRSARARLMKGDAVDYDQKKKNLTYAGELYEEISQWEQRLWDHEQSLLDAKRDIARKAAKPAAVERRTLRLEDVAKQMRDKLYVPKKDTDEKDVPGSTEF